MDNDEQRDYAEEAYNARLLHEDDEDHTEKRGIDVDDVVWDSQRYCGMQLKRQFWKMSELGVGKVCNTPVNADERCPNWRQHEITH